MNAASSTSAPLAAETQEAEDGLLPGSVSEAAPRQLLIGLDAMEWTLVERWASAGVLPTFRRLLAEGEIGRAHV